MTDTKIKLLKYALIASVLFNIGFIAEHGTAYLVAKSGRLHADVQVDGWQFNGGTAQHAEREQKIAALDGAETKKGAIKTVDDMARDIHDSGLDAPAPAHKPAVPVK